MANKPKKVKVTFHTLAQQLWKKRNEDEIEECPFYLVEDVLTYVNKLAKKAKFLDLKGKKFCYLETISRQEINDNVVLLTGFFKSARNEFRPDLINKRTGVERKNPKEITEGDIEKTHFIVKIDKEQNEVFLFLENNFHGVTINNIIDYLTNFSQKYCNSKGNKKNFTIVHFEIPRNNFLTELEALSRTSLAEIYFDKKMLGSNALNFSNRTISLQKDLVLTAKASTKESITEVGIDLWNKLQQKDSPISKIRIKGIDQNKHNVLLDTNFACKTEYIEVDLDADTGEVNSIQLFTGLKNIANSF
jgi:hypothetical protein